MGSVQSLSKSQQIFFAEIDRLILKLIWKCEGLRIVNTILNKKTKTGGLRLPGFKPNNKDTVIKRVWYWCKARHGDQWNRIESPEINLLW